MTNNDEKELTFNTLEECHEYLGIQQTPMEQFYKKIDLAIREITYYALDQNYFGDRPEEQKIIKKKRLWEKGIPTAETYYDELYLECYRNKFKNPKTFFDMINDEYTDNILLYNKINMLQKITKYITEHNKECLDETIKQCLADKKYLLNTFFEAYMHGYVVPIERINAIFEIANADVLSF